MKVLRIPLPDWVEETSRISVFAGIECIADYHPRYDQDHVRIKVARCAQCGECCRRREPCPHLIREQGPEEVYCCGLRGERPISCCVDLQPTPDYCSIRHVLVPIEEE